MHTLSKQRFPGGKEGILGCKMSYIRFFVVCGWGSCGISGKYSVFRNKHKLVFFFSYLSYRLLENKGLSEDSRRVMLEEVIVAILLLLLLPLPFPSPRLPLLFLLLLFFLLLGSSAAGRPQHPRRCTLQQQLPGRGPATPSCSTTEAPASPTAQQVAVPDKCLQLL